MSASEEIPGGPGVLPEEAQAASFLGYVISFLRHPTTGIALDMDSPDFLDDGAATVQLWCRVRGAEGRYKLICYKLPDDITTDGGHDG